eukprot:TRINITY_DN2535_c1_g1_i1.p1 TRINITY_DN2535_c1_g1~~TRINITY_DN2535_c1_g1_i1.p1  ORF type:complete len:744 (+),score=158.76 TRINITY_DN2535_c1_g1_i1:42-2273(+)
MSELQAYVGRVMALQEANSGLIKNLAKEAADFPRSAEMIVDVMYRKIRDSDGKERLAAWYLLDAIMKTTSFGRTTIAPRVQRDIVQLAMHNIPWADGIAATKYRRMVGTWRQLFGDDDVEQILQSAQPEEHHYRDRQPGGPREQYPNRERDFIRADVYGDENTSGYRDADIPLAGGDVPRNANPPPRRPPRERVEIQNTGPLDSWESRNQDELHRRAGEVPLRPPTQDEIAPPQFPEISVPVPRAAPGAPLGHTKPVPVDHVASYVIEKQKKLREILANAKRKKEEDADDELDPNETDKRKIRHVYKKRLSKLMVNARFVAPKVDEKKWPVMPTSFPREADTDVQIGNYVDGVIFLRDVVRETGGAIELSRLNNKIPEIKSLANRIKSVREFIDVHTPTTFRVTREEGRIIIRLAEDPPPEPGETPSWLGTTCPECGKVVPGHNLPKHRNSKMCIGMQMLLGKEGKGQSTIAQISDISYRILQNVQEQDTTGMDDDDIEHFGKLIDKAADGFRTKYSKKSDWTHVLRAIKAIHTSWVLEKQVETSADIVIDQEDKPMVKFLEAVGTNMYRLPIGYMEFGEFEAMCGPFLDAYKSPPPKPARFGSTKIRPKECASPGLVFCDSDRDSDNPPDSDKESDDDFDKTEDTAAPLTMSQVLSTIGTEDTGNKSKLLKMAASSIEWKINNPMPAASNLPAIGYEMNDRANQNAGQQEFTFNNQPTPPPPRPVPPRAPEEQQQDDSTTFF